MVVSLSVLSIVFLAMGSVMMVAAKAIPDPEDASHLLAGGAEALEQLATELQVATSVSVATDKGIAFTVPDRDNDGVDETISYIWDGAEGTPLCRRYSGGRWVAGLPQINGFELSYVTREVTEPGDPVTSAEVELESHPSAVKNKDFQITDQRWTGLCIVPLNLPSNALSWSVTRVVFMARRTSADPLDQFEVQLRPEGATHLPEGPVLESHSINTEDLINGYSWVTVPFNNVRGIAPTDFLCLVIRSDTPSPCMVRYDNKSGGGRIETDNAGGEWILSPGHSMLFYAYGTYTTPGADTTTDQLRSVRMVLTPGGPTTRARSTVTALNRPTMP